MESNKKIYHVITDEYLKIQESLGIKDPLVKFAEWRLYIEFFGKQLFPKDQTYLHNLAIKLVSELPEKYHEALLSWISRDPLSKTISEALNAMLRHFLLGMIGVSSKIFETKEIELNTNKDEIDLAVEKTFFTEIPELEEIQCIEDNVIDIRLIELLELQTHFLVHYPNAIWVSLINLARKTQGYMMDNPDVGQFMHHFINDDDYDKIVFKDYKFTDFTNRFFPKDAQWRDMHFGVLATYIDYVNYDFKDEWVEYSLHLKPIAES